MIRFSNGHELDFACGSGALAFDGRGWPWEFPLRWLGLLDPTEFTVVAKTVTLRPRAGNLSWKHPWTCVRVLKGGSTVNAVGLTNPGIDAWIAGPYRVAKRMGYRIAVSIQPEDPDEAEAMGRKLAPLDLAYVEVNASCPNKGMPYGEKLHVAATLAGVGLRCPHPLVLKLSKQQVWDAFREHRKQGANLITATAPIVEAFHAINTVPWSDRYRDEPSPLARYGHGRDGGVGGPAIKADARAAVWAMTEMTSKPIIGGGGITSMLDVYQFRKDGASAFSIGSLFLTQPWRPNRVVRDARRYLEEESKPCSDSCRTCSGSPGT